MEADKTRTVWNYFLECCRLTEGFIQQQRPLAAQRSPEGFTKLWEAGRLDLSVEALVVESKWRAHFDKVLARAETVLKKMDINTIALT